MGRITEDQKEAIINEYQDIMSMINPKNVKITRLKTPEGYLCLWQVDVYVKTHYLVERDDKNPKPTDSLTFWVKVPDTYPMKGPTVYYRPDKRLASANVYRNGVQCIDEWFYDPYHAGNNSSLVTAVRKTIRDIIHDPNVSNFNSAANKDMIAWQKSNIEKGIFPTCDYRHVFCFECDYKGKGKRMVALPGKSTGKMSVPPALPVKRN